LLHQHIIKKFDVLVIDDIISNILTDDVGFDGKRKIDIKKIKLDFLEVAPQLKKLNGPEEWIQWIYDHFIPNNAPWCLNLPSNLRKKYTQIFEGKKLSLHTSLSKKHDLLVADNNNDVNNLQNNLENAIEMNKKENKKKKKKILLNYGTMMMKLKQKRILMKFVICLMMHNKKYGN